MSVSHRRKSYIDKNVFEKGLERIEYLYELYDEPIVAFSGGKDSTAVLEMTVMVARKLGRLPVKAMFIDEEAIHPTTIEYVERTRQRTDEINLYWYCIPVKHRNACSSKQPWWYCWHPDKKHLWVRDLPENVITQDPFFVKGMNQADFMQKRIGAFGNVVTLLGIRTQESLRRYRAVTKKKNDNYVIAAKKGETARAFPIYDMDSADVWRVVKQNDFDYNRTYDVFNYTKLFGKYLQQRVAPPYGEQPLQQLWIYAECFPEMWHKMLNRVPGVATAYRYARTELYNGYGKPENMTWQQFAISILNNYPPDYRKQVNKTLQAAFDQHYNKTDRPIPDEIADPLTGANWRFLAMAIRKGDLKGRYIGSMQGQAESKNPRAKVLQKWVKKLEQEHKGIKMKDILVYTWGKKEHKEKHFSNKAKSLNMVKKLEKEGKLYPEGFEK